MDNKERFNSIFKTYIHRGGCDNLLEYINKSDFFVAPASSRFHLACAGGLCMHTLNVYDRLNQLMDIADNRTICFNGKSEAETSESIAIVSLLHDLCKINFYIPSKRNVKNKETGKWESVDSYEISEKFPMGHGEKSNFIIQSFMPLTPAEGTAIRFHMGEWDCAVKGGDRSIDKAWEKYPLGLFLHIADTLASKLDEA